MYHACIMFLMFTVGGFGAVKTDTKVRRRGVQVEFG